MSTAIQWGIPVIVGILTFFAGRAFERHKIAQSNRLRLLEPIEEWVSRASRLVGIIGDDVVAVSAGLPFPTIYSPTDRLETAKSLSENREKVLGILKSKALSTRGTRHLAARLSDLLIQLGISIEREYMPADDRLLEKMNRKEDTRQDILGLLAATSAINLIIQEIYSCIAQLKIRFN